MAESERNQAIRARNVENKMKQGECHSGEDGPHYDHPQMPNRRDYEAHKYMEKDNSKMYDYTGNSVFKGKEQKHRDAAKDIARIKGYKKV